MSDPSDHRRVVVIGLDAMDAGIARGLVEAGSMPNLGAFLTSAAWAPTENPRGLLVGGVWPTIASGCWPDRHGFYCDLQIEPGTYEAWRHDPDGIAIAPVWDVLADHGVRSVLLDVPVTRLSGHDGVTQLVDWGTHDRLLPTASAPASLVGEIVEQFGEYPVQPKCDHYTRSNDPVGLFDALLEGVAVKERIAGEYLAREDWDLCWFAFSEGHCAGHQFWAVHDPGDPKHDPALRAELGDALVRVYQEIDGALGRLLARIDDDVTVVVLLSHGMGPHDDGDHLLGEILRRLDAAEGTSRRIAWRERAFRRVQRGARVARRARPLEGELRFFKVPNNELSGAVRINLRGREPRGRVAPGDEYRAVVAQLRQDLLDLENPDNGAPVVREVWCAEDRYRGPLRDTLPDVFIEWNRGAPITAARSAKIGTVRFPPRSNRSGDHRPTGLFALRGPEVVAGMLPASVRAIDIAPTIAARFGVTMPDVVGAPVSALVDVAR
jgi:predicted AlkP superfamily phosphohydrolase/phosphomutase